MNRTDTVKLCRFVRSLCPDQKFDQFTPDAWAIVLDDVRYEDAIVAVRKIYRELGNDEAWGSRKIEADDIVRQVKRTRSDIIAGSIGAHHPPAGLSPVEYLAWYRDLARRLGDGEHVTPPAIEAAKPREIRALGQRIEDAA